MRSLARKNPLREEELLEESHPVVKGEVIAAARKAVLAGADEDSLRYLGAGASGIIFEDKLDRVYKVGRAIRRKRSLKNEAEFLKTMQNTEARFRVPEFYKYDPVQDVLVRENIHGRTAGWGSPGLRDVADLIAREAQKNEWSAPEFKEDSFIVREDGKVVMVDLGYVYTKGSRAAREVDDKIRDAKAGFIDRDWKDFLSDIETDLLYLISEKIVGWDLIVEWLRDIFSIIPSELLEWSIHEFDWRAVRDGVIEKGHSIMELL